MPWYNGDYPPSYKNQPVELRRKAVEIANELLGQGLDEGIAIATGLKRARTIMSKEHPQVSKKQNVKLKPASRTSHSKHEEKLYRKIYEEYQDFQLKKRQYVKALHLFHDHTVDYNDVIDKLTVKEMDNWRKEFLEHEREFHDVMDSFDRSLDSYSAMLKKLKPKLVNPATFSWRKKSLTIQIIDDELKITENKRPD